MAFSVRLRVPPFITHLILCRFWMVFERYFERFFPRRAVLKTEMDERITDEKPEFHPKMTLFTVQYEV